MKQTRLYLSILFLLSLVAACNKDEEETENRTKLLTVTETTGSGSEKVTTKQEFAFNNELLQKHTTTQTYTDLWLEAKYTHTIATQLSYEPGKVIITDEAGNESIYIMDDKGRATNCTRNEPGGNIRTYTFNYSTSEDGILTGIKENINGKPYSEITITFLQEGTINISESSNNYQNTFIASTNSAYPGISNTMSRLPWLFLAERCPLSLHTEALYANILGAPLPILPGRLDIEGSDEITTYSYNADKNGYIIDCAGRTSVSSGRSWSRYVQYAYTSY